MDVTHVTSNRVFSNEGNRTMDKQEYAEYEQAVKDFFEREGINCLSQQPIDPDAEEFEYNPDSYFSNSSCDCCGGLPGDRRDCSGYNPTTKEVQSDYSICPDCEYYAEYGCLDDTTMLDIEE